MRAMNAARREALRAAAALARAYRSARPTGRHRNRLCWRTCWRTTTLPVHFVDGEAEVDPEAARVDLKVTLDSGPAFRFGDIEATGLALHDLELVRRYTTLRPGDPYSTEALLAPFERALLSSPYLQGPCPAPRPKHVLPS